MSESRIAQARLKGSAGVHQLHEMVLPAESPRAGRIVKKLNPYRDRAAALAAEIERDMPEYLEALEFVSDAAQTIQQMEENSSRNQAPETPRAARTLKKFNIANRDRAAEAERDLPDYLQALELVSGAAQTMQSMEENSSRIQAKAFELMQQARADRQDANERIAGLVQQLTASEARAQGLEKQLAEAELRAQTAEQWLSRFMETVNEAFAVRKSRIEASITAA